MESRLTLNTIVVPLDGTALAARALPFANQLARAASGRLVLVRAGVAQRLMGLDERVLAAVAGAHQAEQELGALIARLRGEGLVVDGYLTCDDAARVRQPVAHSRR